jgi:hypothetical protein
MARSCEQVRRTDGSGRASEWKKARRITVRFARCTRSVKEETCAATNLVSTIVTTRFRSELKNADILAQRQRDGKRLVLNNGDLRQVSTQPAGGATMSRFSKRAVEADRKAAAP